MRAVLWEGLAPSSFGMVLLRGRVLDRGVIGISIALGCLRGLYLQ
jgi:hypothetical protein